MSRQRRDAGVRPAPLTPSTSHPDPTRQVPHDTTVNPTAGGRRATRKPAEPRRPPTTRPQPDAADRRAARRGAAAAPRPGRPARRRRPRLGQGRRRHRRRRRRAVRPTCRCSSRSASPSAWRRRPTARPRWPPSSATWSSRASYARCRPFVLAGQADRSGDQELINYGVLGGIVIGLIAGVRCGSATTASSCRRYLAFFGGRRFVPIITAVADDRRRRAAELRLPARSTPA